MPKFLAIVLALCLTCLTSVAAADEVDIEIERLEAEAAAAYSTGEYQTAINLTVRANQLRPHPNYLLNIAVSYSKLGDCENAVLWANAALEAKNPLPVEARPAAEAVLDECAPAPDIKGPNNGVGGGNNGGNNLGPVDPKPSDGLSNSTIWGIVLVGVGAVGATLDLFLWDLPLADSIDKFNERSDREGGFSSPEAHDDREASLGRQQIGVLTVYLVSAAAIVTGGVLITMDMLEEEPPEPGSVQITPLLGTDSAGLQLGFSW